MSKKYFAFTANIKFTSCGLVYAENEEEASKIMIEAISSDNLSFDAFEYDGHSVKISETDNQEGSDSLPVFGK